MLPSAPTTNNALESVNKCFKKTATKEVTPGIASLVTNIIPYWLGHVSVEDKGLSNCPVLDDSLWRKAQVFADSDVCKLAFKATASMCNAQCTIGLPPCNGVVIPSTKNYNSVAAAAESTEERRSLLHDKAMQFRALMRKPRVAGTNMGFNDFIDNAYAFFILYELPEHMRPAPQVLYACTCPAYAHYLVCKHSLGYGIATSAISVPVQHDNTIVGPLPKRGRPKKVGSAWELDEAAQVLNASQRPAPGSRHASSQQPATQSRAAPHPASRRTSQQPATQSRAASQPASRRASQQPATQSHAASQPAVPAASRRASQQPATQSRVAPHPAASRRASHHPATQSRVASQPAASRRASQQLAS